MELFDLVILIIIAVLFHMVFKVVRMSRLRESWWNECVNQSDPEIMEELREFLLDPLLHVQMFNSFFKSEKYFQGLWEDLIYKVSHK